MKMLRLGSFLMFLFLCAGTVHAQSSAPFPPEVKAGIQKLPRLQILGTVDVSRFENSTASTKPEAAVNLELKAIIHNILREFLDEFSNPLNDPATRSILGWKPHLEQIVFMGNLRKGDSVNGEICFLTGEFQPGAPPATCLVAMKSVSGKEYAVIRSTPSEGKAGENEDFGAVAWISERTVCFGDEAMVRAVLGEEVSASATGNEDLIQGLDRVGGFARFAGRLREIAGPESPEFAGFERLFLGIDAQAGNFQASGFIQSDNPEAADKVYSLITLFKEKTTGNALSADCNTALREGLRYILSLTEITHDGLETRFRLSESALLELIRVTEAA